MKYKKNITFVIVCIILLLVLCGCSSERAPRTIKLDEAEVGMKLICAEFFAADGHPDLLPYKNLIYIDDYSTGLMSLDAKKIDGFYAQSTIANEILRNAKDPSAYNVYRVPINIELTQAFQVSEKAVGINEDSLVQDEFRAFMEEFIQTETYDDILRRIENTRFESYERKDVELPAPKEAVKTLRIGYAPEMMPYSMLDSEGTPYGGSIEIAAHFAKKMGYAVEWVPASPLASFVEVPSGRMAMFIFAVNTDWGQIPGILTDTVAYPVNIVFVTDKNTLVEGYELMR